MATKHCVIRTDLASGVNQYADLVSLRFYTGAGEVADVDNGVIVQLEGSEDGQREVMKAVAAAAGDDLNECAIVAGVEVMYDERLRNLEDYYNEAGKAVRGYVPRSRNLYAFTAEGFVGGNVPAVGGEVGIGEDGKIDAAGTGLGKCEHIETVGRYTYYTIRIGKTEL